MNKKDNVFLITYHYTNNKYNENGGTYNYSINNSIEEFITEVAEFTDGRYVMVSAIEVSKEQATYWKNEGMLYD